MSGSNVMQGIRYYKLLFEALLRTKLRFLEDSQLEIHNGTDNTQQPIQDEDGSNERDISDEDYDVFISESHLLANTSDTEGMDTSDTDNPSSQKTMASQKTMDIECMSGNQLIPTSNPDHGDTLQAASSNLQTNQTAESLGRVANHPDMVPVAPLPGGMAMWMDSLIDMADLLLNLIHFQRTGNWEGFLQAVDEFLPWCFALNRQNYARNMSYFYVDMQDLKRRNPSAYRYLKDGGFSGSLSGGSHTKLPMDQLIEMTITRLSKSMDAH